MGHQLGVNHAGALAEGGDADLCGVAVGTCDFEAREGGLLHRVGGEDGLRGLHESGRIPRRAMRPAPGSAAISFSAGSGTPMMPVEEGKTSSGAAGEDLGGGGAGGAGGVEAGLAGGAVGVAGVDGDHAHFAPGGAQVLLVHDERRGDDAVGGEGGGGAGRRVGDDEGKVGAAAGLERRL